MSMNKQDDLTGTSVMTSSWLKAWTALLLFSALSFTNATIWITFSVIADDSVAFFQTTYDYINWLSMIFMLVYFVSVVAGPLQDSFGLKFGSIVGATLNFIGAAVRVIGILFINPPYTTWINFAGQTICALAQCFILAIPGALAEKFFPQNMQNLAASIAAFANQLGISFGFFLSPYCLAFTGSFVPSQRVFFGLILVLLIHCLMSAVVLCLIVLQFPSPPEPKDKKKKKKKKAEKLSNGAKFWRILNLIWVYLKAITSAMLLNLDYIFLFVSFGVIIGIFYSISTLIHQIVNPMGGDDIPVTPTFSGWLGVFLTLIGIIGGMIFGFMADYFKMTVVMYQINVVFVGIGMFILCLCVQFGGYEMRDFSTLFRFDRVIMNALLTFSVALFGVGFSTCVPLGLTLSVSMTKPKEKKPKFPQNQTPKNSINSEEKKIENIEKIENSEKIEKIEKIDDIEAEVVSTTTSAEAEIVSTTTSAEGSPEKPIEKIVERIEFDEKEAEIEEKQKIISEKKEEIPKTKKTPKKSAPIHIDVGILSGSVILMAAQFFGIAFTMGQSFVLATVQKEWLGNIPEVRALNLWIVFLLWVVVCLPSSLLLNAKGRLMCVFRFCKNGGKMKKRGKGIENQNLIRHKKRKNKKNSKKKENTKKEEIGGQL